jgi:hypothetical protein
MILLHNIGPKPSGPAAGNYNSVEQISELLNRDRFTPLSFDGVYLNVWENRALFRGRGDDPILFVMGNVIGGNNSFDRPMPPERYCDWWHLMDLVTNYDCQLGWHTWSHRNLCELSDDEEVLHEVTPPFPMKYFAYPYGNVDERVEKIVRSVGCYEDAYSVVQGHGGPFQRKREYL